MKAARRKRFTIPILTYEDTNPRRGTAWLKCDSCSSVRRMIDVDDIKSNLQVWYLYPAARMSDAFKQYKVRTHNKYQLFAIRDDSD